MADRFSELRAAIAEDGDVSDFGFDEFAALLDAYDRACETPKLLLKRAESYSRDAVVLRADGETRDAVMYETIAREFRHIAAGFPS